MSVSDPIADMLTRIRNAMMAGHTVTAMPSSKIKADIAKILKDEGFVKSLEQTLKNINEGTDKFNQNMEALKHNFLTRSYFRKQERQEKKEAKKAEKEKN